MNRPKRARPVRLAVRHALEVAERGAGADPEALAAVRAVVGHVDGAERLRREALDQRRAALVGRIGEQQLIRARPVFGVVGVQRRDRVVDGAQAVHLAFAEQVAAFAYFFHQLLERNGAPLARSARADALERAQHAVGAGQLLQHGRAARARGGAAFQAVVAAQPGVDLAHRRMHGRRLRGGQRVVRVARHAQDAVGFRVHAQAHAALGPATQAAGGADGLARLGRQCAGDGIDAEFRGERIAAQGVGGGRAGAALGQALDGAGHGFAIAGREGGHAAGHGAAAGDQLASARVGGRVGVGGGMLLGHGMSVSGIRVQRAGAAARAGKRSSAQARAATSATHRPSTPAMPSKPSLPQGMSYR